MANFLARTPRPLLTLSICSMCLATTQAHAQTRWYLATLGADTLSLERFERAGNRITGVWVTYSDGVGAEQHREIVRHEYDITLAADDPPQSVHLVLRHPDGTGRRTIDARFTDDSVIIAQTPDTVRQHTIAAHRAYPMLTVTMAMWQPIGAGARASKPDNDSTTVPVVQVTGPFVARDMPVRLLSASTFRFGNTTAPTTFTGPGGAIDSLVRRDGALPVRQVSAFDLDAIVLAASRPKP